MKAPYRFTPELTFTMSWQSYVDDHMVATQNVRQGAILGLAGGVWATSAGFTIAADEISQICAAAANPASIMGKNLQIAGVKYMVLRADDSIMYGRKGSSGFCIAKTAQALMVGVYDDKIQAGNCNTVVEKLADYLKGTGY